MTDGEKRKVMAIGIILIFLLFGFVKANDGNQTTVTAEGGSKRTLQTLGFLGCYLGCGKFEASLILQDMMNQECRKYCADNAQIYAATRGKFCGCTSSLEYMKPFVKPTNQDMNAPTGVTGAGTECAKACPGSASGKRNRQCDGAQCCGGEAAYTVYGTGQIPLEKQLAKRLMAYVSAEQMRNVIDERNIEVVPDIDDLRIKFILKEHRPTRFKVCTATTSGIECAQLAEGTSLSPPLTHITLTVVSYDRETRYTVPHESAPLKDATDTAIDLSQAQGGDGKLTQTFSVANTNSYSSAVTSGFSVSVEMSNTVTAGFVESSITAGYTGSFEFSAENTKSVTTTNTVAVETQVPSNAKGATVTLMKEYSELSIAWKAETKVSGQVRLLLGGTSKDFYISNILLHDEQTFFTGGIAKHGDRARITAIVTITGRNEEQSSQPAKAEVASSKSVLDTTREEVNLDELDTDDPVVEGAIKCGTNGINNQARKCGGAIEMDFANDKKVECETDFRESKEICSISCEDTRHTYLYGGGKEKDTTENLWSGTGERNMERLNALIPLGRPHCLLSENLAVNRYLASDHCKTDGKCYDWSTGEPKGCCAGRANDGNKEGVSLIAPSFALDLTRLATISKIRMFIPPEEAVRDVYEGVHVMWFAVPSDPAHFDPFNYMGVKLIDDGVWKISEGEENKFVDVYFKANFKASSIWMINGNRNSKFEMQEFEVWGNYVTERRCKKRNCCTSSAKCENDEGYCDNDNQCKSQICGQPGSCHWEDDQPTRCCQIMNRCDGTNAGCCTPNRPCLVGDGDCDYNYDCAGNLICGNHNCHSHGQTYDDDCCKPNGS